MATGCLTESIPAKTTGLNERIGSMDQFRGYSVAGMFLVNFLGGLAAIHPVLKHNNTYFSYADSIMPCFLFAAGFSSRLTMLRRLSRVGVAPAYRHAIIRSFGLIFVSLALFGPGAEFPSWGQMTGESEREFLAKLFKAEMWNVLAIIGAVQLLTLPVVATRPMVRALTMVAFMAIHVALSASFNYEFVYGRPSWMDDYWGAAATRAWDGGFFGLLMWSVPLLGGTLAYDIVAGATPAAAPVRSLVGRGVGLMALGYLLSCLSTLYEREAVPPLDSHPPAASPVLPPLGRLGLRSARSVLAEPPFVAPPPPTIRLANYWVMDKRVVTLSFTLFSTGFAFALYGLFVWACDDWGWRVDLFRMLGQNPLAAYLLHYPVLKSVRALVPRDSPLWWGLVGLVVFFAITTTLVRYLDRHKLYLRL
jgi:predicted acyltransferase